MKTGMDFKEGQKSCVENDIFWSEIGSGLENRATHPYQKFRGVPPRVQVK